MGNAGKFGFFWFLLVALCPSPTTAGEAFCPKRLNDSHCGCATGFEGPDWEIGKPWEQRCEDINECVRPGPPPCPALQSCENTEGDFRCVCYHGYQPKPPTETLREPRNGSESLELECEDIDECRQVGEGRCRGGSLCLNTPGSFECHCPPPGKGPPGEDGCPAVPVPPEVCGEEKSCDLGLKLEKISGELRGGRDPRSVLEELLSLLDDSLALSLAAVPTQVRLARLSALLETAEALGREAAARMSPGTVPNVTSVTNVTSRGAALSLAVSRGLPRSPVTLSVPKVQLEVPAEVALDGDSDVALVALLSLPRLPLALQGAPRVLWGGWGSLGAPPPRRGRTFRCYRLLSPVATAFVARVAPRGAAAVRLSFGREQTDSQLDGQILCAFWNPKEHLWDTRGCREVTPRVGDPQGRVGDPQGRVGDPQGRVGDPQELTVCVCDHLSSFAVLLAFGEIQDHWLLDLVTRVALGLSVVALGLSVATFALCRALGELRSTLQLHLSLSLLVGDLTFLLGIDSAHQRVTCTAVAVILHLSFLSAFTWMALQGLHLHVLLVRVFPPAWLRPKHLLAMGYTPPAMIVALAAALNPQGFGTDQYCWLSLDRGFRWSFQGPVIVISAVNAVILVVTLWKLVQKFNEINPDVGHLRKIRVLLVTSLGQLALLGSCWALGLGAGLGWAGGAGPPLPPGSAPPPLPLLFCLLNAAQGIFIFLCHCLGHPKVRSWYRSLLCHRAAAYSEFTSHTSNTSKGGGRSSQSHQSHQ